MGAKRWGLMLVCAVLYLAPLYVCPGMISPNILSFCRPSTEPLAAASYGLYGAFCVFVFTLSAFRRTVDRAARCRVAGVTTCGFFVLVILMYWPNAVWGTAWESRAVVAEAHGVTLLVGLLLWAAFHRKIARSRPLWRRLDPREIVPMGDRRRAVFWHPALALFLHAFAIRTELVWITGL